MDTNAFLVLCAAALIAGCRAPAPQLAETRVESQGVVLSVREADGSRQLVAELRNGDRLTPMWSTGGIRLRLAGAAPVELPFSHAEVVEDRVILRCGELREHQITMTARVDGRDRIAVEVVDRVGLRSSVVELSIGYRLAGGAPADEWFVPHAAAAGAPVGDDAWHVPLAFVRRGDRALALLADVERLAADRRIPQALWADPEAGVVRHGLLATGAPDRATAPPFAPLADGLSVRAEDVGFAHALTVQIGAPDQLLPVAIVDAFRRQARPRLADWERGGGLPSLAAAAERANDELLGQAFREGSLSGQPVGYLPRADGRGGEVLARFRTTRNDLLAALALARRGAADPAAGERARRIVDLVLALPRRAGLRPAEVRMPAGATEPTFAIAGDDAPVPGAYQATDTAWSNLWLLELATYLPDRRARILDACRATAAFLIDNQRTDGTIPAWYEPTHLAPRLDVHARMPGDGAVLAWFLACLGRDTGDERALAAARRLLDALTKLDPDLRLVDSETAIPTNDTPSASVAPLPRIGSFGLIAALRAAQCLHAARADRDVQRLSLRWTDTLGTLVQTWAPPWRPEAVVGGLSPTNTDTRWSAPRQALAAVAFAESYRIGGRLIDLQRASATLRASVLTASRATIADRDLTLRVAGPDLASAALTQAFGAAVVDYTAESGVGVDAVAIGGVSIDANRIRFDLTTTADDLETVLVRLQHLPAGFASYTIVCNGVVRAGVPNAELAAGIALAPRRLPNVAFDPPRRMRMGSVHRLAVEARPVGGVFAVETEWYRDGLPPVVVPLTQDAANPARWQTDALPAELQLRAGTWQVRALAYGADTGFAPLRGLHAIELGDTDEIRVATAAVEIVDDGGAAIVPYVDGRRMARELGATPFTCLLPVRPEATSLSLALRAVGPIEVLAGDAVIHADDAAAANTDRDVQITLGDRRLWASGEVLLRVRSAQRDGAAVARLASIRFDDAGAVAIGEAATRRPETPRAIDATVDVYVLPVSIPQAPFTAPREAIEQAFFGGEGYGSTPAPQPRRTSGSLRTAWARVTGNRVRLDGRVAHVLELPAEALLGAANVTALVRAALAASPPPRDAQVFVIHGGDLPPERERIVKVDGRRVVVVPERVPTPPDDAPADPDAGSFLPTGYLLDGLLRARAELPRRDLPQNGRFGSLALNADADGHIPGSLIGLDQWTAGLCDELRLTPTDGRRRLELAPLSVGRTAHVLAHGSLPGRGDLHVEVAEEPLLDGGELVPGLLLYWHTKDARPYVQSAAGATTPNVLRLSADPTLLPCDMPFVDGAPADLLVRGGRLDGASTPALTTPQGDVLFALEDLRRIDGRRLRVELIPLAQDLLETIPTFQVESAGRSAPLTPGQGSPIGGRAANDDDGLALTTPVAAGGAASATFAPTVVAGPVRLFGSVSSGRGAVRCVVLIDGREVLATTPAAETPTQFCVEIPLGITGNASLTVRAVATGAGGDVLRVTALQLVPRAPSVHRLPIALGPPQPVLLQDGVLHGRTLVLEPNSEIASSAPIVLPGRRAMLRILAALADGTPADARARLSVRIRSIDGGFAHDALTDIEFAAGRRPLWTGLVEIPETSRGAYRIEFRVTGSAPLHVVDAAIDRG